MQVTSRGRFAVDALVNLALWDEARPVALTQLSERLSVSLSYLEQIFRKLREQGIVASVRGGNGGYTLARSLEGLTVAEILLAVDEAGRMESNSAAEGRRAISPTSDLWASVNAVMTNYLLTVSLKDLVAAAQNGHTDVF